MQNKILDINGFFGILILLITFICSQSISFLWVFKIFHSNIESFLKFFCTILCIFIVFWRFIINRNKCNLSKIETLIVIFTVITLISKLIIKSTDVIDYAHPIVFCLNILSITTIISYSENHDQLTNYLFVSIITLALLQMFYLFFTTPILQNIRNISHVTYSEILPASTHNPNRMGIIALTGAICSLYMYNLYFKTKKKFNITFLIFFAIFVFFITISGSRSSLLGISVATIAFVIIKFIENTDIENESKGNTITLQLVLMIISIIIVMIILVVTGVLQNFIEKFNNNGLSHRDIIWETFLKEQLNSFPNASFFFGQGYHKFKNPYWPEHANMHNFFLEIWGRHGLISALLITLLIIHSLYNHIKIKPLRINIPFLIAFIFVNIFESNFYTRIFTIDNQVFFFIAILGYYYKHKDIQQKNNYRFDSINSQ